MTRSRLVTALATFLVCGIATSDNSRIALEGRDPGVKRWISYEIVGPRNHPFPIVYLSTLHFETWLAEFLIVLPEPRYDIVAADTQARIARPDCPGKALYNRCREALRHQLDC